MEKTIATPQEEINHGFNLLLTEVQALSLNPEEVTVEDFTGLAKSISELQDAFNGMFVLSEDHPIIM